jgi:FAD binding domain
VNEQSIAALRARLAGDFVVPGDTEGDDARKAWNLAVDQRQAAVALPESAQDVAEIVTFARTHALRVAPQGTGHNAAALAIDGGSCSRPSECAASPSTPTRGQHLSMRAPSGPR